MIVNPEYQNNDFLIKIIYYYKYKEVLFSRVDFINYLICKLLDLINHTMTGTIKTIKENGFGFISSEELNGKDLFFHGNELVGVAFNDLREGDKVTFETAEGPKGLNAINVQRA